MSIELPPAPVGGIDLVRQHAPLLMGQPSFNAGAPDPEVADPIRVELVMLDESKGYQTVIRKEVAWLYLLFAGDEPLGIAELCADPLEWAAFHPPEIAEKIVQVVRFAERLPQIDSRPYDLRLVDAPFLPLSAIWLQSEIDDVYIPYEVPGGVGEEIAIRPFDSEQFNGLLTTLSLQLPDAMGNLGR
jgi:hypothetical protein